MVFVPIFFWLGGWRLLADQDIPPLRKFSIPKKNIEKNDQDIAKILQEDKEKTDNCTFIDRPNYREIDGTLISIYLEDDIPRLAKNKEYFIQWKEKKDKKALEELERNIFLMKGSSRMIELPEIISLTDLLENLIVGMLENKVKDNEMANKLIEKGLDILSELINRLDKQQDLVLPKKYITLLTQFIEQEKN